MTPDKPEIALEKVECRPCRGSGDMEDKDGYFPCSDCLGIGFNGYLITESQVREIVGALQAAKKYFGATNQLDKINPKLDKALSILVKK